MEDLTFNELPKAVTQLYNKLENIEQLLLQKKVEISNESEELLTIQQAATFLKLSVPTLYGYVHRTEIPVSKKGKRLYFSKQELLGWVKEGRKKTSSEIDSEAKRHLQKRRY